MKKFLVLALSLVILDDVLAVQTAIVIKKFAIIYSDKNLQGPIGKLPRKTRIRVGSLPLSNGKSLPIQVQNRLAYISLDDVVTEENTLAIKHRFTSDLQIEHPVFNPLKADRTDDFTKDNHIAFEFGQSFFLSGDWSNFNQFFHNGSALPTKDFTIYAQHRPQHLRYYVAVGLSYFSQSDFDKTIRAPLFIADIFYTLIKFDYFSIDIGFAAYGTGDLQLKMGTPNSTFRGSMFGAGPKLNLTLFPNKLFSLHISGRYQYFKLISFGNLEVNGIDDPLTFDEMSNFSILAGFSFKLM